MKCFTTLRDCKLKPMAAVVAAWLVGTAVPFGAYASSGATAPGNGQPSATHTRESAPRSNTNITSTTASNATIKQLATIRVTATAPVQLPLAPIGPLAATPLKDIPQSVTVVDQQLMQAQGATNFQQALNYVPGITFAAAEGGTIGNNINLRGFNARTDVYLDGFRDRGQYYRDTFSLDSIEVLQGPSSMLFGRGSTGGIVNQVSKIPSWTPHDVLQASVGTSNQYRFTGDFDHAINDEVAYRVPVMVQSVDSTRDVMHDRDYGVAPSLRIRPNSRTDITLTSLFEHNHDMADYGLPPLNGAPAPVSRDNFYGLTDDHTTQDVAMGSAGIRFQATPNLVLRNELSYVHYRIDAIETAPGNVGTCSTLPCTAADFTALRTASNPASDTTLPLDQLYVLLGSHARDIVDESAYDQFDATWKFDTGFIRHKLVVGGELGHETYRNQALAYTNLPVLSLLDPAHLSAAEAGAVLVEAGQNLARSSATTYAVYANDTASFGDHWKLVAGVRRDRFNADLTNSVPSSRNPAAAAQDVYHSSVRAGILYQPTVNQTWYASYGTAFDPALETLTVQAGQVLPPSTSRSLEVGNKLELFGGGLSLNTALFQVDQSNTAVQIETGVYAPEGSVRVRGGEISANGNITPQWNVFGGYTRLNGRIVDASPLDDDQGNVPANMPQNNATLWNTYAFTPHWSVGGGAIWQSRRYANTTNVTSVPSFVRFDATIAYIQPQYDVRLNLINLTNKLYYSNVIQSDGGRAAPGPSRTAMLTVTWHID